MMEKECVLKEDFIRMDGKLCAREDSNFHDLSDHQPLKLARLPIPPRAQK